MFNVINFYLQPDSKLSVDEAACCLAAALPENRPAGPNEDKEPVVSWMIELSDLIWEIAKQVPCNHEGQDKLVQLLLAFKRLPTTQTIKNWQGRELTAWWNGLDGWHDSMRHALYYPEKREDPDQETCDRYVNASAFAARVHAARAECPLAIHAFASVGRAVEDFMPDNEFLPCHLIGGAQWIILATEWLWGEIWWGKINYNECKRGGSSWLAFPPAHWVRWLRGFQRMAATGEEDDVKYWARLAAAKMEEMMQSEGFTAQMMEAWNPERRTLFANMWEDEKYAFLFQVPRMQEV